VAGRTVGERPTGAGLSITGLTKRYGPILAVDDVSLAVAPGRLVGFVGPNGAGKSTTMRSVFGLVEPDAGSIAWNGSPVGRPQLDRFGYLPEQRGLYPKMPVAEQVAFFAQLKGLGRREASGRAETLLASLGLGDRLGEPLERLSHGNQQRVQLAVALANDPDLLVLDEPFSGLDPVAVDTLEVVLRARVEAGAGVLFSSHQLDLVERLCDEIVIIVDGRIQATGTVRQVRAGAGFRRVLIEVDRPTEPLDRALADLDLIDAGHSAATIRVGSDAEVGPLLDRVRRLGPVVRLDYDHPSLTDQFASIVDRSNGAPGHRAGGGR
jgi:ABC-2 type transport system ATP-binding protein